MVCFLFVNIIKYIDMHMHIHIVNYKFGPYGVFFISLPQGQNGNI